MNSELEKIRSAVREQYGVRCGHLRSEAVAEFFDGDPVWQGIVEVFSAIGARKPVLIYAWAHETENGGRRYVTVLGKPPINTARDAVRSMSAATQQRSSSS